MRTTLSVVALTFVACGAGAEHEEVRSAAEVQASTRCGEDVIKLAVNRHPSVQGLTQEEIDARWIEYKRCLAEFGDAEAALTMGIAYRDGSDGPPRDYAEAVRWFRRAAQMGNPTAQYNLGLLLEAGNGVPADPVEAYAWYLVAYTSFAAGDGMIRGLTIDRMAALERWLSLGQVTEAHLRAERRRATIDG